MKEFHIGDEVRVAHLVGSPWQNARGTVVEIIERPLSNRAGREQECAVRLDGNLRWFLADHLRLTLSARFVRFFRAEVLERWQLNPADVARLMGDREELIALLCDSFSFSHRRAEKEVSAFLAEFNARIASTAEGVCVKERTPQMDLMRKSRSARAA